MTSWYYMVTASLLLIFFLCFKEWQRRNKNRRLLRMFLSSLAAGSLLFLAYPFKQDNPPRSAPVLILATGGAGSDSIRLFQQQRKGPLPVYSMERELTHELAGLPVQFITEPGEWFDQHKDDTLHVFGNGFTNSELELLNNHPIIFHSNPATPAIVSVYWQREIKSGEPFTVQGQYSNPSARKIKILLRVFNETADSLTIAPGTNTEFCLHTIPKNTGQALFYLVAVQSGDTLQSEPMPLIVKPSTPMQLLFLSSSPSFENTLLKNRLAQNGYGVTMSTTISRNKSGIQFLNMPLQQGELLTVSNLKKFDVVISDDQALRETDSRSLQGLVSAIAENGLGLLVRMHEANKSPDFYSRLFPVYPVQPYDNTLLAVHSVNGDSMAYTFKPEDPVFIRYQSGTKLLMKDARDRTCAASAIYGNGKIVALTIGKTFSLALSGNNESYRAFWAFLLQEAAKKSITEEPWQIHPQFPTINEPVTIQLATGKAGIPIGQVDVSRIYLQQFPLFPWEWQGVYWPAEEGWQSLIHSNGNIDNWYVYKKSEWKKTADFQKLRETKKYASRHPLSSSKGGGAQDVKPASWLPVVLLIIFFLSCAFLWIEQKAG